MPYYFLLWVFCPVNCYHIPYSIYHSINKIRQKTFYLNQRTSIPIAIKTNKNSSNCYAIIIFACLKPSILWSLYAISKLTVNTYLFCFLVQLQSFLIAVIAKQTLNRNRDQNMLSKAWEWIESIFEQLLHFQNNEWNCLSIK